MITRERLRELFTYKTKHHNLGYYNTPEDAARAYNRAALEHFGNFAYLNDV